MDDGWTENYRGLQVVAIAFELAKRRYHFVTCILQLCLVSIYDYILELL
jgi:hypothetical protein